MAYLLHDLRNIAGINIHGHLSLIPDAAIDSEFRSSLAIAKRNAKTAFKVLSSNLHDFATDRLTIVKDVYDLHSIVHQAYDNVSVIARDKGIRFHYQGPEKALIMADQKLISVFDNLMRNAANYSPAGSVIECELVDANIEEPSDAYQVTIKNLAYLKDDQVRSMFADRRRYSEQEGTGYGLSNVKTLLGYHGGGVYAEMEGDTLVIDVLIPKGSV